MAVPANSYVRGSLNGTREDLSDIISMISPEETPLYSMLSRKKADSPSPEWQTDKLRAPNKDNAIPDGDTFVNVARQATRKLQNHCQTFSDTMEISGRAEVAVKAGRDSEMAYQLMLSGKALKLDIDAALCSNNAAVAAVGATPGKLAGFETCIATATNINHGSGGATAAWTVGAPTTAPTDGTQRAFTETLLKGVIKSSQPSGLKTRYLFTNTEQREKFSLFTGIASNRHEAKRSSDITIFGSAGAYVSDFGDIFVITDLQMRQRTALLIDPEHAHVAVHRPMKTVPLAKVSDSERKSLLIDLTLCVKNPDAHGKIADLT